MSESFGPRDVIYQNLHRDLKDANDRIATLEADYVAALRALFEEWHMHHTRACGQIVHDAGYACRWPQPDALTDPRAVALLAKAKEGGDE